MLGHDSEIWIDATTPSVRKPLFEIKITKRLSTVSRVPQDYYLIVFIEQMAEREGFEPSVFLYFSSSY